MAALAVRNATTPTTALAECEAIIERGLATFIEVGRALLTIRDDRLYRATHSSFEDYCRERWGFSRVHAHRQIEAAKLAALLPTGNAPTSERAARELAPLLRDAGEEAVVEVWRQLRSEHGPKVTAEKVRGAVVDRLRLEQKVGTVTSSETVEWYTPPRYVDAAREVLGGIDLDPASCARANQTVGATTYYDAATDGLAQEWAGRVWLNPPYGRDCPAFIEKVTAEHDAGRVLAAVLLLSAYSVDTSWFQPLWRHLLCFVSGRIAFESPLRERVNPTAGSVFVYLGPDRARFAEVFAPFGAVMAQWPKAGKAAA